MAKRKASDNSVRLKAQQIREAQQRADRRMRNIVIGLVALVVIAVVATVAVVIGSQVQKRNNALDLSKAQSDSATMEKANAALGQYAQGAPIVLTKGGIGTADPSLPTLTEYFDYSCHACADVDVLIGTALTDDAIAGKYNLELQPVETIGMEYMAPATSASLIVAQKDPQHWVDFHHKLLKFFASQFNKGEGRVIKDTDASWKQVQKLAAEAGVSQDIIDTFPVDVVSNYLATSTQAWKTAPVEGRDPNSFGTPEYVKDHKTHITLSGKDAQSLANSIRSELGIAD
ncbi:thioredoxin [Schaalia sp. ZJ405]|uniref:DsbA family protein n=1 Tax=Schaalia sp. ZJ405 TaxID=2709403 RepID=UPI0013EA8C12|nr:DsbA family protein [Schaalia sp. ZJ405]QPK81047.1 thioredoxin [Schaalia sp. ZJ405]